MADPVKNPGALFDLTGRVALVTGASSGLGERFAQVLAAAGAKVVIGARRVERLESLAASIKDAGGEALAVKLDVTDKSDITAAFDAAETAFGCVDILLNNAGVGPQHKVLEQTEAEWRFIMDTNLDAVWFVGQEAARRMVKHGADGSIINIASVLSFRNVRTLSAYATAKAAVVQLTKSMALELADQGVRVNAIAPGYILTEINQAYFSTPRGEETIKRIPMQRIGQPSDLDGVLLLLSSSASSFMTGETVTVDGGHVLPIVF